MKAKQDAKKANQETDDTDDNVDQKEEATKAAPQSQDDQLSALATTDRLKRLYQNSRATVPAITQNDTNPESSESNPDSALSKSERKKAMPMDDPATPRPENQQDAPLGGSLSTNNLEFSAISTLQKQEISPLTTQWMGNLLDKTIGTLNVTSPISPSSAYGHDFDALGRSPLSTSGYRLDSDKILNETQNAYISQSASLSYYLDSSDDLVSELHEDASHSTLGHNKSNKAEHKYSSTRKGMSSSHTFRKKLSGERESLSGQSLGQPIHRKQTDQGSKDNNVLEMSTSTSENSTQLSGKDENESLKMMTPFTTMKNNNLDLAVEETKFYTNKIKELKFALEQAKNEAASFKDEAKRNEVELRHLRSNLSDPSGSASETLARLQAELDKMERRNDALMERNETLLKECKFADQTCVELGCRNSNLEEEVARLNMDLQKAKEDNNDFHNAMVRAAHQSAKFEAEHDALVLKVASEKSKMETQLEGLSQNLLESKQTIEKLDLRAQKLYNENAILKAHLREMSESGMDTLDDATSVAQSQIEDLNSKLQRNQDTMQAQQRDLHRALHRARRYKEERDSLKGSLYNLEQTIQTSIDSEKENVTTPGKPVFKHVSHSIHTPTSQVLAKTLQAELDKAQRIQQRFEETEKALSASLTEKENLQKRIRTFEQNIRANEHKMHHALRERDAAFSYSTTWVQYVLDTEERFCNHFGVPKSKEDVRLPIQSLESCAKVGQVFRAKLENIQYAASIHGAFARAGSFGASMQSRRAANRTTAATSFVSSMVSDDAEEVSYNEWAEGTQPDQMSRCSLITSSILEPEDGQRFVQENKALKRKVESLHSDLNDKMAQIEDLNGELYLLRQENSLVATNLKGLNGRLSSEEKQNAKMFDDVNQLREKVHSMTASLNDSEERCSDLKHKVTELEIEVQDLRLARDELQHELGSTNKSKVESQAIIDRLEQQLYDTEYKLSESLEKYKEVEKELNDKSAALSEERQKSELLTQEIDILRTETKSMGGRIMSLESSSAASTTRTQELQEKLSQLQQQYQREEFRWKNDASLKDSEIRSLKESARRELESCKSELKEQQEARASENKMLQESLERIRNELTILKQDHTGLKAKLQDAKYNASVFKEDAEKERENFQRERIALEKEVSDLRNEVESLQEQLDEAQNVLEKETSNAIRDTRALLEAEDSKARMMTEISVLKESLKAETETKNDALVQIAEVEDQKWSEM